MDLALACAGLPPTGSWQDLKDHMREAGDVCYADVFKDGTGVVEFLRYDDMKYAVRKLDDTKFRSHEVRQKVTLLNKNGWLLLLFWPPSHVCNHQFRCNWWAVMWIWYIFLFLFIMKTAQHSAEQMKLFIHDVYRFINIHRHAVISFTYFGGVNVLVFSPHLLCSCSSGWSFLHPSEGGLERKVKVTQPQPVPKAFERKPQIFAYAVQISQLHPLPLTVLTWPINFLLVLFSLPRFLAIT